MFVNQDSGTVLKPSRFGTDLEIPQQKNEMKNVFIVEEKLRLKTRNKFCISFNFTAAVFPIRFQNCTLIFSFHISTSPVAS